MIPYGRQDITEDDIKEVEKVLRSDFLTQGPMVPKFEQSVSHYCGSSFSVGVNSATSALHIACLALDLGPGDLLWTSPITFVASANCARYCGANVDFIDIDPKTYNICPNLLSVKLAQAKKRGKIPKILAPVHFAGQPSDMEQIAELSKEYGFKIIEDASHAIGASYKKNKVGSCKYSDITVFSFHPVKIITTAEGGMALTNSKELFEKMTRLRTHGITTDKAKMSLMPEHEIWNYQQIELGFNYRMNDIQAALGLNQMKRLDSYVQQRHKIANNYDNQLEKLLVITPYQLAETISSYHLYPILLKNYKVHKKIYEDLRAKKIGVNLHYIPVYRHPYYKNLGFKKLDFPEAEKFYSSAISLPIYPSLKEEQQEYIIDILKKIIK